MKIVRLYTGTDGESHFEDIEVELKSIRHMMASELVPAHGIMFRTAPADSLQHVPPGTQTAICHYALRTGRDRNRRRTIRRFGPGDVMLAEDNTGRGHITRVVGGQPRHYVFIPLK